MSVTTLDTLISVVPPEYSLHGKIDLGSTVLKHLLMSLFS